MLAFLGYGELDFVPVSPTRRGALRRKDTWGQMQAAARVTCSGITFSGLEAPGDAGGSVLGRSGGVACRSCRSASADGFPSPSALDARMVSEYVCSSIFCTTGSRPRCRAMQDPPLRRLPRPARPRTKQHRCPRKKAEMTGLHHPGFGPSEACGGHTLPSSIRTCGTVRGCFFHDFIFVPQVVFEPQLGVLETRIQGFRHLEI